MTLTQIVLTSAVLNPLYGLGAVVLMIFMLRWLDRRADFNFREWLKNADDQSKAIYFGARFIGASIVIGLIVSLPV